MVTVSIDKLGGLPVSAPQERGDAARNRVLLLDAARRLIALSAHAMAGDRDKALAAGCDEYDTKPVNLERLLAKIRALLPPEGAAS